MLCIGVSPGSKWYSHTRDPSSIYQSKRKVCKRHSAQEKDEYMLPLKCDSLASSGACALLWLGMIQNLGISTENFIFERVFVFRIISWKKPVTLENTYPPFKKSG